MKKCREKVSTADLQKKRKVFRKTQLVDSARSLLIAEISSYRMPLLYWCSRILAMQLAAACLISEFPALMYSKREAKKDSWNSGILKLCTALHRFLRYLIEFRHKPGALYKFVSNISSLLIRSA